MRVIGYHVTHGAGLTLPCATHSNAHDPLIVVVGGGRGCVFKTCDLLSGIWIPLRGRLICTGSNAETTLLAGDMRVTEAEPGVHASGRGNALWVALLGSANAWRNALAGTSELPLATPILIPAIQSANRTFRKRAANLIRSFANGTQDISIEALLDHVITLQQELAPLIARCPGRSFAQRRQVFLRLQRVRNYLAANCQLEIDNDTLARMANYSPWHFIRAFRIAYEQTPHAYLVEQRLKRARRLLRQSPLTIAEIATASGFENRCAFSRLFRQRFGKTAGTVRREDATQFLSRQCKTKPRRRFPADYPDQLPPAHGLDGRDFGAIRGGFHG